MSTSADFPRWNRSLLEENILYLHKACSSSKKPSKRRRGRDDDYFSQPRQMVEHHRNKRKFLQERRIKRARTPVITGRRLPVHRLVEVLDHSQLKRILETVMAQHPEAVETVQKSAEKPSTDASIELIKEKAAQIAAHLPYKCDVESDYSYIRVKPHLTEFLNCISDFILDLLPPMESVLATSCHILNTITNLVHELPNFSNNEYQYTRIIAYQQLANLWLTLLSRDQAKEDEEAVEDVPSTTTGGEPSLEWLKTVENMNLLEQMEKHNEVSDGKFTLVVDFMKNELGAYAQINNGCSPEAAAPLSCIFNDLITVDYSNYSIAANISR